MILSEAQQKLLKNLHPLYDEREAATIADWVMEKITGLKKIDRILLRDRPLSAGDQELLKKYTEELQDHRPIQYVLGESWFCGLRFRVDERVLIPRPETEELVEWILQTITALPPLTAPNQPSGTGPAARPYQSPTTSYRLLDIGTGSGCIPVSLKKKLPAASVFACDISEPALTLARQNAADNHTDVDFFYLDILHPGVPRRDLPLFDLIVSNPPYIPQRDRQTMSPNVLSYEPPGALFVEDGDPLVFYRAIATFANDHLAPGGLVFVELHENLAEGTGQVFRDHGFDGITLKKDMQGKDRMIRAAKTGNP